MWPYVVGQAELKVASGRIPESVFSVFGAIASVYRRGKPPDDHARYIE